MLELSPYILVPCPHCGHPREVSRPKSRDEFGGFAQHFFQTGTGAEVGVQYGLFARTIAKGWQGKQICVDVWPDQEIFEVCQQFLADPKFVLWRKDSVLAAADFADAGLDWVYIDADHHYANVKNDIEAWFPKVRPGGIVAGHDFVNYDDMEVIRAVEDFCAEKGYSVNVTTEDQPWNDVMFPTWWFVK